MFDHEEIDINCYSFEELFKVPSAPGIYAWYLMPSLSVADLNGSKDYSSFTEAIYSYMKAHHHPELNVGIKSNFMADWSEKIEEKSHLDWKDKIRDIPNKNSIFEEEKNKPVFLELFKSSIPYLSSPLYIGTSDDLNKRISEHRSELNTFHKIRTNNFKAISELEERDVNNFARRVIKRKIHPRNLILWTASINSSSSYNDKIAESIEWILNRCHSPKLGVR